MDEQRVITLMSQAIAPAVASAVKEAISQTQPHKCTIPAWAQPEVGHVLGMVKDAGDGDLAAGIEELRENHKFISDVRTGILTGKLHAIKLCVGGLLVAIGFGLWLLVKAKVQ